MKEITKGLLLKLCNLSYRLTLFSFDNPSIMAPTIFYMVMTEESFDSKFLFLDIITILKQRLFFIHLVFLLFGGNVVKNSQWFCLNPFKHTSSWLFVVKLLINDSWNLKNIMIIEYFYSNVNDEKKNNVFFSKWSSFYSDEML